MWHILYSYLYIKCKKKVRQSKVMIMEIRGGRRGVGDGWEGMQGGFWGAGSALLPVLVVLTQVCSLHKNSSGCTLAHFTAYISFLKSSQKHARDLHAGGPMHPIRIFRNKAQQKGSSILSNRAFISPASPCSRTRLSAEERFLFPCLHLALTRSQAL